MLCCGLIGRDFRHGITLARTPGEACHSEVIPPVCRLVDVRWRFLPLPIGYGARLPLSRNAVSQPQAAHFAGKTTRPGGFRFACSPRTANVRPERNPIPEVG